MATLESFKSAREKYAKKIRIIIWTSICILLVILIASIICIFRFTDQSYFQIIAVISITIFFILIAGFMISLYDLIFVRKYATAYKKQYKAYFIQRTLQELFTDVKYDHNTGIPESVLKDTKLINTGDRIESNDFVSGKYKDVEFLQADVKIEEEHEGSENSYYVSIFKGRYMIFKFPKPFNFRLQIVQKWFGAKKRTWRGPSGQKIQRISTESVSFDKKFKVYAEDGLEAYYILDPALIERIEKLSANHKGKLMLGFVDNCLHVAIDNQKDAFEPSNPLKELDEKAEFEKVKNDTKTITDFVDFLQLDRKLFK